MQSEMVMFWNRIANQGWSQAFCAESHQVLALDGRDLAQIRDPAHDTAWQGIQEKKILDTSAYWINMKIPKMWWSMRDQNIRGGSGSRDWLHSVWAEAEKVSKCPIPKILIHSAFVLLSDIKAYISQIETYII